MKFFLTLVTFFLLTFNFSFAEIGGSTGDDSNNSNSNVTGNTGDNSGNSNGIGGSTGDDSNNSNSNVTGNTGDDNLIFGETLSSGSAGGSGGFRWYKNYTDGPRPLDDSKIKLFGFSKEMNELNYKFSGNEENVLKLENLYGVNRIQNRIVVRNTSDKVVNNIKFTREMISERNCMDVKIISTPFVNYDNGEFTVQKIEPGKDFILSYTLETNSDVNENCKAIESVKILDSSLNEFYGKLVENPISEMYFEFGPDVHYIENGFDGKIFITKNLLKSGDETVVKMTFENISGFDKGYSEFYFRYIKTKIEILSAIDSRKEFEGKLTWSRDIVKNGEKVFIYLKVRKK